MKAALHITRRALARIDVLSLEGTLAFGASDLAFRNAVEATIASGKVCLILDLKKLSEIDSIGCSSLLAMHDRLKSLGGEMALINLPADRLDPLQVERLETVFEPFDIEEEAINSFSGRSRIAHYDVLGVVRSHNGESKSA
jgi:anti-sigma B factor antagonist